MGNYCIQVREVQQNGRAKRFQNDGHHHVEDIKEYIARLIENTNKAKINRMAALEKKIRTFQNGGVDTSEEQDQMGNMSIEQKQIDDQKLNKDQSREMSQKYLVGDSQHSQQDPTDKQINEDDGTYYQQNLQGQQDNDESALYYNSDDEVGQYFNGLSPQKKKVKISHVLASMINVAPEEDIKRFNNKIFKKPIESPQHSQDNIFSDKDNSMDL